MIDNAVKYISQLEELMIDTWYDDKYMFYYSSNRRIPFKLDPTIEDCRSFVVLHPTTKHIIGFIDYWFDGETDSVSGLTAINFTDQIGIFGKDLCQIVDDIFCKYHFNRMEFRLIRGNPIEASYDRMVKRYGGRIIGTRSKVVKLIDGVLYDDKLYEIMRDDFIKAKKRRMHHEV